MRAKSTYGSRMTSMTALRRFRIRRPACQSERVRAGKNRLVRCSRNVVPYPADGKIGHLRLNSRMKIVPIQNVGIAIATTTTIRIAWSVSFSRFRAATKPSGSATRSVSTSE